MEKNRKIYKEEGIKNITDKECFICGSKKIKMIKENNEEKVFVCNKCNTNWSEPK